MSSPIATIEAPLTDQKAWVARITKLDEKWTFGRDQIPPIVFGSRIVFNIVRAGLYEHRNTSHGSGFVHINEEGLSHPMTKEQVISMLE
ncbi:hypothetical protein LFL96_25860 [Paraburkholderia sp. D15]|uniref:hypothetical protein n=1 Tax=Paraburkholderia sp. D15 TaxID=2880218 RepID=UPI0024797F15|nr:hypothetical protein [Paraburkholderia sp. D15]WGS54442.1 hypothetical protein LFL96_25860 [Paraburkholderia sp. D15]